MQNEALRLMLERPAQVARWCGFPRLTDELHGQWMRQMLTGTGDLTILAHRGSYKTTCISVVLAILMCVEPDKNLLFLRKTDRDVTEMLRQVRGVLCSDGMRTLTEAIYGVPVKPVRGGGFELTASSYLSPRGAVQLLGHGIGGSLTGKHADYIFTDDIVNQADRVSLPARERTRRVYQELQNIRNPGGRIINIGTPWHRDDAVSLMPAVQRYDCYTTGLLSQRELDARRAAMEPSLFATNYELKHLASDDVLLPEPPVFADDLSLLRDGFAHVDAAYGGSDFTAFTAAKLLDDRVLLYGRLWPGHVDRALPSIVSLCRQLMVSPLYCETNGDKGYLARELRRCGLSVRPYAEQMPKAMKIGTFLRKWWTRTVWLRQTDQAYMDQLLTYTDLAAHDDAPDSAACVLRLIDRRANGERILFS